MLVVVYYERCSEVSVLVLKLSAILGWFTGSVDQSWYIVLDESAIIKDLEIKKALKVVNISQRDSNARIYEKEIKMRSEGITFNEIFEIINPFKMIEFLKYSMSDIF